MFSSYSGQFGGFKSDAPVQFVDYENIKTIIMMNIDKDKLLAVAVELNEIEKQQYEDARKNGELYKTSMRIAMKIKRTLRVNNNDMEWLASNMKEDVTVLETMLDGKYNFDLNTLLRFEKILDIEIINRKLQS